MSHFKVFLVLLLCGFAVSLAQEVDYDSMYYWGGGGGLDDDGQDGDGDDGYRGWDQVVDDYDAGRYDHEEQIKVFRQLSDKMLI